MSDPTITRNDDGTLSISWPDPPRPTYEVAHEALQFMVDDYNEVIERVATWRGEAARFAAERDWARERLATLEGMVARTASRRCLCGSPHVNHGGPCCGVAGGLCVTCEARALLDASHDQER